jgi:hypothetical protein
MDATFSLSDRQKLVLTYEWRKHPIFGNGEVTISHIALSPELLPEKIIWFDEPSIPKQDGTGNISGRVFTVMTITYSDNKPVKLVGSWFDLDGTFTDYQMEYWKERNKPRRAFESRLPHTGTISLERED